MFKERRLTHPQLKRGLLRVLCSVTKMKGEAQMTSTEFPRKKSKKQQIQFRTTEGNAVVVM